MLHIKKYFFLFLTLGVGILLASCSAERKNILSKAYHNTTAHFNAYFYARERIEEIEVIVENNYENDYNKILNIYPEIDSTLASSYQTQIEDCIKKASIAIQRHKNSRWVDDSYILIGLARFYDLDYVNAIKTFKFVNTESEDDAARHEALAHLLRTFTDAGEYSNAIAVSDYLKKEKISKENMKLLHLNRAHYYQVREDYDNMVQNLVKAAPLLNKKDGKGRIYFIIGQTYQELGFDAEAFNYYKKCIASNPAYELDFYARLNMAQVTELGKTSDVRAARKLFQKLLKDKKNKEFKDKIYYEMGEFELKRGNIDEAIDYYGSSVQVSEGNERQKGMSYHRLGIIYYDSLRKYEKAQAYYDSAVQTLPKDFEEYLAIEARKQILDDFVEQINTIYTQDSLLMLSEMDSAALKAKIEEIIAQQKAEEEAEAQKAEEKARRQRFQQIRESSGINQNAAWYFGNPAAVAQGQNEFRRIWGDRPLEDHWRRSNKKNIKDYDDRIEGPEVITANRPEGDTPADQDNEGVSEAERMMTQVPSTEAEKEKARQLIEEALYKLGNIYNFDLKEDENARITFEQLLNRFPETAYKAEVLYQLYLINKELNRTSDEVAYKNQLLSQHPNTTYAKLVANPNYTEESTEANEQQKKVYKAAYALYDAGQYDEATRVIDDALRQYPETIFTPRLKLLKVLITGKTEDINLYQYQLSEFIEKNPDSDITPYAKELLEASREFLKKQQRLLGTKFVAWFDKEHYFILMYETKSNLGDQLSGKIEAFNETYFEDYNLKTSNLILNEELAMIMVTNLIDKPFATDYYAAFIKEDVISENSLNSKFSKFVITKDNFNILYQSKDWEAYLRFFEKHYEHGF
ncbi:MAG: tetratricopeptide repeat protein [Fulvivirga sp.]|nr:tetratricopeptide repeat protein [Fulvivirga sp.]